MMTETNISQFKNWLAAATPDEIVTIAPTLFNRFGNLDQSHQQRLIQDLKQNPQAMSVFEKLPAFSQ